MSIVFVKAQSEEGPELKKTNVKGFVGMIMNAYNAAYKAIASLIEYVIVAAIKHKKADESAEDSDIDTL